MDQAGYESMEFFLSVMFKKYVREHKENPWYWLKEGTKTDQKNPPALSRRHAQRLRENSARSLKLFIERLVSYGLTLTRTSNCWNDYTAFKEEIADLKKVGMDTVANLIYSVSPRHTDEYYARKAAEAAAANPWRICFKDVGGLLSPERARTLIPVVLESRREYSGRVSRPLQQRPSAVVLSGRREARHAHPAYGDPAAGQRLVAAFDLQHREQLESARLRRRASISSRSKPVEKHFTYVAKKDGLPIGKPVEYDQSHVRPPSARRHDFQHAPSDSRSSAWNTRWKRRWKKPPRCAKIRLSDHGHAAIPVRRHPSRDQRHRRRALQRSARSNIQYALGIWGKEAVEVMDPNVKDKILNRPRAKEWTHWEQPEPTLHELRQKYGVHLSDEDLILHYFAGEDYVNALPDRRQAARISRRDSAAGKDHRATGQAQRIESGLHQAARLLDPDGKTLSDGSAER